MIFRAIIFTWKFVLCGLYVVFDWLTKIIFSHVKNIVSFMCVQIRFFSVAKKNEIKISKKSFRLHSGVSKVLRTSLRFLKS